MKMIMTKLEKMIMNGMEHLLFKSIAIRILLLIFTSFCMKIKRNQQLCILKKIFQVLKDHTLLFLKIIIQNIKSMIKGIRLKLDQDKLMQ